MKYKVEYRVISHEVMLEVEAQSPEHASIIVQRRNTREREGIVDVVVDRVTPT